MQILKSVSLKDFRSFTNEKISLEKISCIVGANESGKSNLLNAIYHLSPTMANRKFQPQELRMGALNYPKGKIELKYEIQLTKELLGRVERYFPELVGSIIEITKTGKPKAIPEWQCNVKFSMSKLKDIVKINNKNVYRSAFKTHRTKTIRENYDRGWFLNDSSIDLRKKPYKQLLDDKKIVILSREDKKKLIERVLKNQLLKSIKIFQWTYKEKDFLPEIIKIEDFLENPSDYKSVRNIFQIAGWKPNDFSSYLTGQVDSVYVNLFKQVEQSINRIIHKNWSTHKKLEIVFQHKGEYFTINLTEPGSITPPEYRSDGLKWFLTFLINFRAQSENLKNYILLIDEPGLHLHPRGQKDTLSELSVLSSKFKNQIIYSTHQTFLIDKNKPGNVRIIKRELDKSGPLSSKPFFASKISSIDNPKSILTDKLLREALGFNVSDISPLNEKNILVEGVFDRDLLHFLNKHWSIIDLNETSIISCFGCAEISKHANLYLSNGLNVMCFYDSDSRGISCFKRNNQVKSSQKKQIRDFIDDPSIETIEDLLPESIFYEALGKLFKKYLIDENNVAKPRMKNLNPILNKDNKVEMKHFLETSIMTLVKLKMNKIENELEIFKPILKGLLLKD